MKIVSCKWLLKLAQMMEENPNLPVLFMVDNEVVGDDSHWWVGKLDEDCKPYIDEYTQDIDDECYIFKSDDDYNAWFDDLWPDDEEDYTDEEIRQKVDAAVNWKKAIFAVITTL